MAVWGLRLRILCPAPTYMFWKGRRWVLIRCVEGLDNERWSRQCLRISDPGSGVCVALNMLAVVMNLTGGIQTAGRNCHQREQSSANGGPAEGTVHCVPTSRESLDLRIVFIYTGPSPAGQLHCGDFVTFLRFQLAVFCCYWLSTAISLH
ncbi:hypothetical protein CC80DRAFT_22056 [Byssothecium circinans]|uniref:Uncharacterized protein n=1 Tax=Byssothecium circinans TaxID=147558 RepID=A0A6A5U3K7_9PLEO|nr:hypothetical protein CC80DRAFT_22056 [Byssothecium circinans]